MSLGISFITTTPQLGLLHLIPRAPARVRKSRNRPSPRQTLAWTLDSIHRGRHAGHPCRALRF